MMKSLLKVVGFVAIAVASAAHAEIVLKQDHPDRYYVESGDSLWGIAEQFLESPWQWPEIWHVNDQIDNPHLIYPGDVVVLSYVDGRPVLSVQRTDTVRLTPSNSTASTGEVVVRQPEQSQPSGEPELVKLVPVARELPVGSAIPAVPLKSIQPFLVDNIVVSQGELDDSPYVLVGADSRVIVGRGDILYARDQKNSWQTLTAEYGFYRKGERYVDLETNEILGYEAEHLGAGRVVSREGEVATVRVLRANREIGAEDMLVSSEQRRMRSVFYPKSPAPEQAGRVLRIFNSISYGAQFNVIVLDVGSREGIEEGHVFATMKAGGVVRDRALGEIVPLPDTQSGVVIVFRVFEKVSYAMIMRSTKPVVVGDRVQPPRAGIE